MTFKTGAQTDTPENPASSQVGFDIRHISARDLAKLGVSELAYVKPVTADGALAYAIHAADGTPMALAGDLEVAIAAIRQHEMVPALVH